MVTILSPTLLVAFINISSQITIKKTRNSRKYTLVWLRNKKEANPILFEMHRTTNSQYVIANRVN